MTHTDDTITHCTILAAALLFLKAAYTHQGGFMSQSLEKLLERQRQLAAQIRDVQMREKKRERKKDTRRKVIAGALALQHMEKNPNSDFGRKMTALINEYVTKPTERELFGFAPLENNDNAQPRNENKSMG